MFIPPESLVTACDAPTLDTGDTTPKGFVPPQSVMGPGEGEDAALGNIFAPFMNPTCGLLMAWQYTGTNQKSAAELDWLAKIQMDPLCDTEDLRGFAYTREMKLLDKFLQKKDNPFHEEHGWKCSPVSFHLPKEKVCFCTEADAPSITVDGIYHRDLTDIIKSAFEDSENSFHTTPFMQHWKINEHCTFNVFSEPFTSLEMIDAYKEVNTLPWEPGNELEWVVAGLMVWSDSTHLASFGNASMWPFYLFFANQSKYMRCKPSVQACHHVAYIPMVCVCIASAAILLIVFIQAYGWLPRNIHITLPWTCHCWNLYPLQVWTVPKHMGPPTWWKVHACIQVWHHGTLCRWDNVPHVPSFL